jgi:hypothetical protein
VTSPARVSAHRAHEPGGELMRRIRRRTMARRWIRAVCLLLVMAVPVTLATTACGKSVGNAIDDATITARVKTALLNDPEIAGLKIDVDTFKGVVTLSGSVQSPSHATKAMAIAMRTPGVTDVKSTLQVSP